MRTPQSGESKGSLRWMQRMVSRHPSVLDTAIGLGPIGWRSPLANDEFAEYRDEDALALVGALPRQRPLSDFWPARGPQWDALGRAATGQVVLVEAKAHVSELFSGASQATGDSLTLISRSLEETARALGAQPGLDWTRRFYQYANRLAMAYFLHEVNGVPTRMVFLHFIGDQDMNGPASRAEWRAALDVVHEALGIRGRVPPYVAEVFIDVRPEVPIVA
jgi:hypothetical protein